MSKPDLATSSPSYSFFSRKTYSWADPIFLLGAKRPLNMEDLPALEKEFTAEEIYKKFQIAWQHELDFGNSKSVSNLRVIRAVWRAFKYDYLWGGFYLVLFNTLNIASPIVLQLLLNWLSDSNSYTENANATIWKPYTIATGLFTMQVLSSCYSNWQYELAFKTGYRLRTALTMALYRKSFTLSGKARQTYSAGKIVNISITDTNRLDMASQYLNMLWASPIMIILATAILYFNLGVSVLLTRFRAAANKQADKRIKTIHETLKGIRVIKMYAWEESILSTIFGLRSTECRFVRFYLACRASTSSITQTIPSFAMIITFTVYATSGNFMDPSVIISSLALFYALRIPMLFLPIAIGLAADSWLAFQRIGDLLLAEEFSEMPDKLEKIDDIAIKVENASFQWEQAIEEDSEPFKISNVNITIPKGKLVAIVGAVGAGKSSLLSALVGEMKKTSGNVTFYGSIGYCQQQAWIQNNSLRDNILFGLPYDKKKYRKVIETCALKRDIEILQGGDTTEIGENGINLSGGQKQRVSIARAVYNDTDTILLDDPLSAVDAHVGRYLFETCIKTSLKGKTRVLVTHQLHFLNQVDSIIFMDKGEIVAQGTFKQLVDGSTLFSKMMEGYVQADEGNDEEIKEEALVVKPSIELSEKDRVSCESLRQNKDNKLTAIEERATGGVAASVWSKYWKFAGGVKSAMVLLIFLAAANSARIFTDQWLVYWLSNKYHLSRDDYIKDYYYLGFSQLVLNVLYGLSIASFGARSSRKIHNLAITKIFSCTLSFFDSTPLGRITSRFSRDVDTLDTLMPESLRAFIWTLSLCISNIILIGTYLPWFLLPAVLLMFLFYYLQQFYLKTALELKRIDSISRSPLIAQISETLNGLVTIRAYQAMDRFKTKNDQLINVNNRPLYLILIVQRWIQLRLECLNSILVFFIAIFCVYFRNTLNPSITGLLIAYSLQITQTFTWVVKTSTDVETYMNSAERMIYYTDSLVSEKARTIDPQYTPTEDKVLTPENINLRQRTPAWPENGHIQVRNLQFRYLPNLPLVLKDLSFDIQPGQKVGIVGRTGAGKSTIITTILRLVEFESGNIFIDGVDIKKIGLKDLRSKIAVIPQEPVLFSGTIRFNLDPFSEYTGTQALTIDDQIWDVLQRANLFEVVKGAPMGLESVVAENGENWSTGQRQLICLARAMLKNSKIILLDEATASVDFATDEFIQTAIRRDFQGSTIITIAHRLNTIADYDKIMVLSFGEILEYDSPKKLLDIDSDRKTYSWADPIFLLGAKRPLNMEDLPALEKEFTAEEIYKKFQIAWQHELDFGNSKSVSNLRVIRAVWRAFKYDYLWGGFYLVLFNTLNIASPIVLQLLLNWLSDSNSYTENANATIWKPYTIATGLFTMQVLSSCYSNWQYELAFKTGYRLRTALTMALYRKSFTLSGKARQTYSAGKIVNISITDTNRLDMASQYLNMLWASPIMIILATAILYFNLGVSVAFCGFAFIVLYIPFQYYLSVLLTRFRAAANKQADKRIKTIHETLKGIRVIKMYAWEESILSTIFGLRSTECRFVRFYLACRASTSSITQTIPSFAMIITFTVYATSGNFMDPSVIISSLALFYALRIPMLFLPIAIGLAADSWLAFQRIGDLLLAEEFSEMPDKLEKIDDIAIKVENASFQWEQAIEEDSEPFKISNVNITIPKGKLVAIVGAVGAGKSSLLSALVGEMKKTSGNVTFYGSIGYCQQQAWIQNNSLRDNILFGLPYDKKKYRKVIETCALKRDIEILQGGDTTEIGENGINLSGGQKQRVSIARAVYNDTDTILLDDPLSAVDAHVGRYLFETCIKTSLKGKTRVLVTHQLHFLNQVDSIIFMDKGEIVAQGTFKQLVDGSTLFSKMMEGYVQADEGNDEEIKEEALVVKPSIELSEKDRVSCESLRQNKDNKLTAIEERATGGVAASVWSKYWKFAGGVKSAMVLLIFLAAANSARIFTDQWLVYWLSNKYHLSRDDYIKDYYYLGFSQLVLNVLYGLSIASFGARSSRKIHNLAITKIFSCTLSFFDSTPLGRITSRFSRDVDTLDTLMPESLRAFIWTLSLCISNIILIGTYLPWFLLPAVLLMFLFYYLQQFYLKTALELKRIDSISRSPLIAQISETLNGLVTIRAYQAMDRFKTKNDQLINVNNRPLYLILIVQRWIQLRLECLNSILVFFIAIFCVYFRNTLNPSITGLLIAYSLQITQTFTWVVKTSTDVETYMNSAERMIYYTDSLVSEKARTIDPQYTPTEDKVLTPENINLRQRTPAWPENGHIQVRNLQFRYLPNLPLVLKDLSFDIQPGQKVGIVGRTGAGKSTIITTILRLVEFESGNIFIDGVDIKKIGLKDLRSKIAVIPQEPVLFSGTIRFNLDPFSEYTGTQALTIDDQIWDVLQRANLFEVVKGAPMGLESVVAENGENWSTGQRQLICLARAMLKNSKIILLDEATASVDFATDEFIQTAIRRDFQGSTIITIAHRLNTIADYDKIMVLSFGEILEYDSPKKLLDIDSEFTRMVAETGEANAAVIKATANKI
ncbi:Multidrug resistance-associated protein 1 [Boothiomyces sp. JEL0866]|nr:Multidrug resistance-associated protein 1 [Boothiomyces sp. JEL0866]